MLKSARLSYFVTLIAFNGSGAPDMDPEQSHKRLALAQCIVPDGIAAAWLSVLRYLNHLFFNLDFIFPL